MIKLHEKIMNVLKSQKRIPIAERELAKKSGIRKDDRLKFKEILGQLTASGKLIDHQSKWILAENLGMYTATIVKVTEKFGFARISEDEPDVFLPGRKMQGAMPNDIVLIKPAAQRGELREGEVVRILTKADTPFSGTVTLEDKKLTVIPDRYIRIPFVISRYETMGAKPGDKVLAQLSGRSDRHFGHTVRILNVFGSADQAGNCCAAILESAGIQPQFPDEVLAQADTLAQTPIHPKELTQRVDLREEEIFTIDGADSKDLDDAISLKRTETGWTLGVHIADVSYYVLHKSPLDLEAYERGTSVYFANSVIPMLPPSLSNGICSLNPEEDRLTFSVFITLDESAGIVDYRFEKTFIRSRVKGVYTEINHILSGTASEEINQKYSGLQGTLLEMNELAKTLTKKRHGRGAINLESPESKIILNETGAVVDIQPRTRGESEQMIEEFMLLANESAAMFATKLHLPFIYRVHEDPPPQKLSGLRELLAALGINAGEIQETATPAALSRILEGVRGSEVEQIVNQQILRSMAKAKYSEKNDGHFGLVLGHYAHFTSPIRRYPDLVIHRVLTGLLTGMKPDNINKRFTRFTADAATQSSARELRAMNIERDCESCYMTEYMHSRIGETFDGIISSVVPHGVYVRLANTVEGLVHVNSMTDGDYVYDGHIQFTEQSSKKRYRVGDAVRVLVTGADVSAGKIDFAFSE